MPLAFASTWLDPLYTAKEKNVFQSLIHFCFIWMDGLNISTRFDFVQKIKKTVKLTFDLYTKIKTKCVKLTFPLYIH